MAARYEPATTSRLGFTNGRIAHGGVDVDTAVHTPPLQFGPACDDTAQLRNLVTDPRAGLGEPKEIQCVALACGDHAATYAVLWNSFNYENSTWSTLTVSSPTYSTGNAIGQPLGYFLEGGFFHPTPAHLAVVPVQDEGAAEVLHRRELVDHDIVGVQPMSSKGGQKPGADSLHDQLAHLQ
jgi:hypothetical protein